MTMRWDFVSEVLEWNVVFFSSAVFLGHVTRAKDFKRGINFSIFLGRIMIMQILQNHTLFNGVRSYIKNYKNCHVVIGSLFS